MVKELVALSRLLVDGSHADTAASTGARALVFVGDDVTLAVRWPAERLRLAHVAEAAAPSPHP